MVMKSSNTALNVACECGKSVPIPDIVTKGYEQTIALQQKVIEDLKKQTEELKAEKQILQTVLGKAIQSPPDKNSETANEDDQKAALPPAHLRAYQSYLFAESKIGDCTDKEAYQWLKDEEIEYYTLPAFKTWERYVRIGRKSNNTQKNTSRKGRTGVSVINGSEIESLSEITSQFD